MGKHIKTSQLRAEPTSQHKNWKRRQRRKLLKAGIAARREHMAGWVDRGPADERNSVPEEAA